MNNRILELYSEKKRLELQMANIDAEILSVCINNEEEKKVKTFLSLMKVVSDPLKDIGLGIAILGSATYVRFNNIFETNGYYISLFLTWLGFSIVFLTLIFFIMDRMNFILDKLKNDFLLIAAIVLSTAISAVVAISILSYSDAVFEKQHESDSKICLDNF